MHEFGICQSIVETVIAEMGKHDTKQHRLLKTCMVVGGLRQIVPEYLQFAYKTLTKDTPADGSLLEIDTKPVIGKCKKCGCTDEDCSQCIAKTGGPCHWVAPNKCSACFDENGDPKQ